ncbi:MAG: Gfo/Idh/MocA family oxidoreductase [Verrucomicrobiales bacterium]|nr:Gfo/Idh/MocA family oxidoreductase [Verrucomicrobiales bacterium]
MRHTAIPPAGQTRRHFLQSSTAATVTTLFALPLASRSTGFAANSDTLRIGLIGCGGRGTGAAGEALTADKNTVLVGVADPFEAQAKSCLNALKNKAELKDRVQVSAATIYTGVDGYKKLIESGVDVVLLAAPPGFRPAHLQAAVAAGKHVFCEKPMGTDSPGVRSVMASVQQAREKNLALTAGFCWRYDFARREFYQRVHEGALGEIRAVYATYLTGPVKPMPPATARPAGMGDVEWQLRNWYNFTWLSGDGLVEQACHSVDKIMWAMKDEPPAKAVGNGGRQIPNHEGNIFDHIDVFYEWENGVRAFMAQRQIAGCYSDNSDYVMGEKGTGTIKGWAAPIIKAGDTWRYRGAANNMYQTEHDELFAALRAGRPINDGDWMVKSTLAAIMGRQAAYTGQEITWEQALNSEEKFVPDNLTWDMALPIKPLAVPGKTKFI